MNFVVISPNYPESYWMFCRGLKENGAKVLAIVDTPYNQLKQELKEYCDEIYVVKSFHDYDEWSKLVVILHLSMERLTGSNPIMRLGWI